MTFRFFVRGVLLSGLAGAIALATGLSSSRMAIAQVPQTSQATLVGGSGFRLSQALRDPLFLEDAGDGVAELQTLLANLGYFDGPVTGYFGTLTEEAVIAFQTNRGLAADGVVGEATWAALSQSSAPTTGGGSDFLVLGDAGDSVSQIQTRLQALGYYQGGVDGVFGAGTEAAVIAFQSSQGLNPDGIVGTATRSALNQPVAANPASALPPATPNPAPVPSFPTPTAPAPAPIAQLPPPDLDGSYSVLELQWKLRNRGFYYGTLDGVMGPETQRAIRDAQSEYDLNDGDLQN